MSSIRIRQLTKSFGGRPALDGVTLDIESGEMVALIGASGSGKSTLLRHVAGLTVSDAHLPGLVQFGGRTVQSDGRLSHDVRELRSRIGFVFQQFNLVGRMPVMTNVLAGMLKRVPMWRSTFRHFDAEEIRVGMEALSRVGIAEQAWQRASTLSGGQQQRAAIARTLVQRARAILADEPIASLDPESSRRVMEILSTINREDGCTVVVSLHQVQVALKHCPRAIALHRGRVVFDGPSTQLTPSRLREVYGADVDELLAPDTVRQPVSSPVWTPLAPPYPLTAPHPLATAHVYS
jgi:phosphonate transport system ATP-binding protein